jgi:hypothetical protein
LRRFRHFAKPCDECSVHSRDSVPEAHTIAMLRLR